MFGQAQEPGTNAAATGGEVLQQLQTLGWVDVTALAVLLVFFVIGLFKGLFWQVSRIGILLVAYGLAGRFGGEFGAWLVRDPEAPSDPSVGAAAPPASDSAVYLAYVLVFVGVVVVLSLIAIPLQRLVVKSGLGFFDRVFGGVFGVATGACTVLFLLFLVNMFGRETAIGQDARASHSQRLSREAIDWLGPRVPDELRGALYLTPLRAGGSEPDGENTRLPHSGANAAQPVDASAGAQSGATIELTPAPPGGSTGDAGTVLPRARRDR